MHTTGATNAPQVSGVRHTQMPIDLESSAARPSLTFRKHVLNVLALPFVTIVHR